MEVNWNKKSFNWILFVRLLSKQELEILLKLFTMGGALEDYVGHRGFYIGYFLNFLIQTIVDIIQRGEYEIPNDSRMLIKLVGKLNKASKMELVDNMGTDIQHVEYLMFEWNQRLSRLKRMKKFLKEPMNGHQLQIFHTYTLQLHHTWRNSCWNQPKSLPDIPEMGN